MEKQILIRVKNDNNELHVYHEDDLQLAVDAYGAENIQLLGDLKATTKVEIILNNDAEIYECTNGNEYFVMGNGIAFFKSPIQKCIQ